MGQGRFLRCKTCNAPQEVPDGATAWRCTNCQTLNSLSGRPKRGIGADIPPVFAAIIAGVIVTVVTLVAGNSWAKSLGDPEMSQPAMAFGLGIIVGGVVFAYSFSRQKLKK